MQRKQFCGHTVWSHFHCEKIAGVDYGFWEVCKNSTKIHNYSLSDLIFSCQNASLVFVSQNVDIKILRHGVVYLDF